MVREDGRYAHDVGVRDGRQDAFVGHAGAEQSARKRSLLVKRFLEIIVVVAYGGVENLDLYVMGKQCSAEVRVRQRAIGLAHGARPGLRGRVQQGDLDINTHIRRDLRRIRCVWIVEHRACDFDEVCRFLKQRHPADVVVTGVAEVGVLVTPHAGNQISD